VSKPAPAQDPELAKYYLNFKTSARPRPAKPVVTTLPLKLEAGTRIAFIGNLLLDAERRYGHLEILLNQHHPDHKLVIRNLAWPSDEVDLMPRPGNFADLHQHLTFVKAGVITAAYGYNQSIYRRSRPPAFKERLDKFLTHLKSQAYNGKTAPKVVLLPPGSGENLSVNLAVDCDVQGPQLNNAKLK